MERQFIITFSIYYPLRFINWLDFSSRWLRLARTFQLCVNSISVCPWRGPFCACSTLDMTRRPSRQYYGIPWPSSYSWTPSSLALWRKHSECCPDGVKVASSGLDLGPQSTFHRIWKLHLPFSGLGGVWELPRAGQARFQGQTARGRVRSDLYQLHFWDNIQP